MSALEALRQYFATWFGDGIFADYVLMLAVLFVTVFFLHVILYPTLTLIRAKTYYKWVLLAALICFLMLSFSYLVLPYVDWGGVPDEAQQISHFILA